MTTLIQWLPAALLSLFSFGAWGILTKLTVNYIDPKSALIYQVIGLALVATLMIPLFHFKPETVSRGVMFGLLTGVANGIGCLFYFVAVSKSKVTPVVTLTALYPIVTILLAFLIFKETVTVKQGFGILLALAAIYLLS